MSCRVVLLDAGGTLFTERETRDAIYARALSERGVPATEEQVARVRMTVHDGMPGQLDGQPPYTDDWFREFIRRLLVELGADLDAEELRAALADHFSRPENFVVFSDVLSTLDDLLERGLRLGVVSNWSDRLEGLIDGLGLRRHFEVVVISAVVGSTKPDPGIFRHALRRLDVPAEQALHVGDHPVNDLAGARRAGLAALLIDREGRSPTGPDVLRSLEELPARLGA
jgi:putative hydrolase of the HAD superfamily